MPYVTLLGKAVRKIALLRGGGSALPGLFVEKIDPDFIKRTLADLPYGVVVISGTNGKTTTTKMVVDLLRSQGLTVFTNRTGSNFTRGVAAALLGEINRRGKLEADIAVLELDEAHAVHFVKAVPPRYCLLLNVMRDQLDRFGEINTTAGMLAKVAEATTDGVVINRDDPRLGSKEFIRPLAAEKTVRSFGADMSLQKLFPSDDDLRAAKDAPENVESSRPDRFYSDDVSLRQLDNQQATISYGDQEKIIDLKITGIYNTLNAVSAVALCRLILGDKLEEETLFAALADVTPAFGRGEIVTVGGQPVELVLVKNPSGFRLGLSSFPPAGYKTMIAINDNYADGRDMSWLWDVEFDSLREEGVAAVSGIRAYDMALRLQYDEVTVTNVETDLTSCVRHFITTHPEQPGRIFCTYTAMLAIRRELAKITTVETIS